MASTPEVTGYRDLVEIGRGGFARVYRAHQDRFNRAVALKVLDLADPDERTRDRFERECRAMGELSWHPHVVAVYDSGVTADGHLWLAMEFMPKGSLGDGLAPDATLSWEGAVSVGIQVAGALAAAHAAGTLHRDLKPENVLLDVFGDAKLSDFGIAAVDGGRRTTTGVASFTVAHVAPEVLRGRRQDERTDVYGLASTLHTLLAGTSPFAGDPDEPVAATMMRIVEAPPPRLGEPVPSALADLLVAGLAKDPDDRPQSAAAFGEALQSVQRERALAVTPLRLVAAPAAPPATPAPPTGPAPATAPAEPAPAFVDDPADDRATVQLAPAASVAGVAEPTHADTGETVTVPAPPPPPAAPATAAPPPAPPDLGPTTGDPGAPTGRGRTIAIVVAVAVVLVLVVGAVIALTGGGGDGGGGDAAGTFRTGADFGAPVALALDEAGLWVTDSADTLLYRLDPATGAQVTETGINNVGTGMALTDDGAGWITGDDTSELIRIDLATNEDTNQVEVGDGQQTIGAAGTDVWVARDRGGTGSVVRFDAIDLGLVTEIEVGTTPNAVAATADAVWVTNGGDSSVTRIDPTTNEVADTVSLDAAPSAIAAVGDAVWVLSTEGTKLLRIDPATDEVVATVDLGDDTGPAAVAATESAVWVVLEETDRVARVDPATNEVTDEIEVSHEPVAVAATDTDVWVINSGGGTLTHIDPAAFA